KAVRNIRAEVNTPMSRKVTMYLKATDKVNKTQFEASRHYIERFCNTDELVIAEEVDVPEQAMSTVVTGAEIFLPLEGLIDIEEEIARLEKEREKWESEVALVDKKLSNEGFVKNAPEHIVEAERKKRVDYEEKLRLVEERLAQLKQ